MLMAGLLIVAAVPAMADDDGDEYAPQLPDMTMYKAMLDANRQSGWVEFRNFAGKELIYFTALQTMRCRLKEIRYSINSDRLDKRFPLGTCDPQQPYNMPANDDDGKYTYLSMRPGAAKTITLQVVWEDGAGSEIITYRPCDNVGEGTCARIKKIAKPDSKLTAPSPSSQSR